MKDFQETLKESMESILEPLSSKAPQGINTGFYRFDNILQGMNKGMLTVLASKSGTGKTSFALNIIKNLISQLAEHIPDLRSNIAHSLQKVELAHLLIPPKDKR